MSLEERQLKIMIDLDVDGFISLLRENGDPTPTSRKIALMAIHKARYRHPKINEKLKQESMKWLIDQGCQRL